MNAKQLAFTLGVAGILSCASAQVQLKIDTSVRSKPVSRLLFSKFTEHLGRNVYLGAWAQLVKNPELVPVDYWPGEGKDKEVWNVISQAETIFGLYHLARDAENGFAAFWESSVNLKGRLLKEGIRDFQQVRTTGEAGYIQTGIFPPLHRTAGYEVHLTARSDQPSEVTVQMLNPEKKNIGETVFRTGPDWQTSTKGLHVDVTGHEKGMPYVLKLLFNPGSEVEISRILLFPDDHQQGWDPEVVMLMKEAQLPMLRFPGGNFASGYNWKNGIGPLDQRPVKPNPAWPIMEWNHVGTDEWATFCHLTGARPMICVNAGDGTPELAAEWIEYCNAPSDSLWGKRRAENGSAEPYHVTYWEVGNELCGPWQIGFTDGEGYAKRYHRFATTMLRADSTVKLIANGLIRVLERSVEIDRGGNTGWNRKLMEYNGDLVRSISVHSLVGGYLHEPADPAGVWKGLVAYADNYPEYLDKLVAEPMREAGAEPKVAVTELMDWPRDPTLGNVTSISGALWYSAIVNQAIRSEGMIELITHSALINHGGGLEKDRGVVFTDPVYWANYMYSTQQGTVPVSVKSNTPVFSSSGKYIIKREDMPVVDAVALMEKGGASLTVFVCNRSPEQSCKLTIDPGEFAAQKKADVIMIHCPDLALRNSWDHPANVAPVFDEARFGNGRMNYDLPPLSLARFIMKAK